MLSTALNCKNSRPIGITPGDPAGVGPDVLLDYAKKNGSSQIIAYADPQLLETRAKLLGYSIKIEEILDLKNPQQLKDNTLFVHPVNLESTVQPGVPNQKNSAYVLKCLDNAISHALNGKIRAVVTGPVNKMLVNKSGINFTGHTEYIAAKLNIKNPVMMLAQGELRVVIMTTHIPLTLVPKLITKERVETVIKITEKELRNKFKIQTPRIAICGLNPHAGEDGHVGTEEIFIIEPVIARMKALGFKLDGPIPADTVFAFENYKKYDVVIAMYHDQGLAPFKALAFGEAVNITLGLPIVRTSVDHGTAFDKAATGMARSTSLEAAIKTAAQISQNLK